MKLLHVLIYMAFAGQIAAQKVVLYKDKRDAKWPLMSNTYKFYVPDIPCSNIVFTCTNGKIAQHDCILYYTPDTLKNSTFKAYQRVNKKLVFIDSINIQVYEFKEAGAWLGNKSGGTISKIEALAVGGIVIRMYMDEGHSEGISLKKYRVVTIRKDSIEAVINIGNRFNEKAISLLNKLAPDDTLVFVEIEAKDWFNRKISPAPIEFKIKE